MAAFSRLYYWERKQQPSIIPENLVSPEMGNVLTQARSRCLSELQSDLKKSPSSIFRPNADLKPLCLI